ncbi:hypothetical protein HDV00_005334 [Rhizophlyctis rosea]|nr:hypothetical protein HDV00_005334 [Rhizophlyctis rosea]
MAPQPTAFSGSTYYDDWLEALRIQNFPPPLANLKPKITKDQLFQIAKQFTSEPYIERIPVGSNLVTRTRTKSDVEKYLADLARRRAERKRAQLLSAVSIAPVDGFGIGPQSTSQLGREQSTSQSEREENETNGARLWKRTLQGLFDGIHSAK